MAHDPSDYSLKNLRIIIKNKANNEELSFDLENAKFDYFKELGYEKISDITKKSQIGTSGVYNVFDEKINRFPELSTFEKFFCDLDLNVMQAIGFVCLTAIKKVFASYKK